LKHLCIDASHYLVIIWQIFLSLYLVLILRLLFYCVLPGFIDFKEFSERFWLAVNEKKQRDQPFKYRLGRKSLFARSNWLTEKLLDSQRPYPQLPPVELGRFNRPFNPPIPVESKKLINSRPMGDLRVKSARLIPDELEMGVWPDSYTLSDHGMVEVVFTGIALPPEPTLDFMPFEEQALSTEAEAEGTEPTDNFNLPAEINSSSSTSSTSTSTSTLTSTSPAAERAEPRLSQSINREDSLLTFFNIASQNPDNLHENVSRD
jgi:hypothetical protein